MEHIGFSINVGVHVVILFLFLSAFFIYYISGLEYNAFNNEIDENIKVHLGDALNKLNPVIKDKLKAVGSSDAISYLENSYNSEDPVASMNNKWLFRIVVIINILLFLSVALPTLVLNYICDAKIPIKNILIENGIIFAFIGAVEYIFFTYIASKFIPVQPSVIIRSFIASLKNNI